MMQPDHHKHHSAVRHFVRGSVGALLVLTCLRVWLGPEPILPRAEAQLPNPAAQRLEIVKELRRTNELLEAIDKRLKTGTLHVRLEGADNQSDTSTGPRGADR